MAVEMHRTDDRSHWDSLPETSLKHSFVTNKKAMFREAQLSKTIAFKPKECVKIMAAIKLRVE